MVDENYITCSYCQSENKLNAVVCRQCGAERVQDGFSYPVKGNLGGVLFYSLFFDFIVSIPWIGDGYFQALIFNYIPTFIVIGAWVLVENKYFTTPFPKYRWRRKNDFLDH